MVTCNYKNDKIVIIYYSNNTFGAYILARGWGSPTYIADTKEKAIEKLIASYVRQQ